MFLYAVICCYAIEKNKEISKSKKEKNERAEGVGGSSCARNAQSLVIYVKGVQYVVRH